MISSSTRFAARRLSGGESQRRMQAKLFWNRRFFIWRTKKYGLDVEPDSMQIPIITEQFETLDCQDMPDGTRVPETGDRQRQLAP